MAHLPRNEKNPRLNPLLWKGEEVKTPDRHKAESRRRMLQAQLAGAFSNPALAGGTLGELSGAPLACLPSTIPAYTNRRLPVSDAVFAETFGADFSLIPENAGQQSTGLISKLTTGGSPLAPFFMRSACIICRVDPAGFALTGASVAKPTAGATPPRVPRVVPVGGIPGDATAAPAVFEYNHQAAQGFVDFLQSYQFQYLLQGRFLMINERAIDVGTIDSQWCFKGFGTAQADPSLMIQLANTHWIDSGSDSIFVPPNCSSTGEDGVALEPATVDIQYLTPYAPGVFGVCYPVKPHILFPGQNYQFLFSRVPQDDYYYDRLQDRWTFPDGIRKPSANYNDTNSTAGGPAIWIGSIPFTYGVLQFGVLLRGSEVIPEAAMQWLLMFGQPYYSVLMQDPAVWRQAEQMAINCGLQGLPRPLGRIGEDPRWNKTNAIRALFDEKRDAAGALAGFDVSDAPIDKFDLIAALKELDLGPMDAKSVVLPKLASPAAHPRGPPP